MRVYYNEIDPFAAAWLSELMKAGAILAGDIDTRSIKDVQAYEVRGYDQAHFFAGIGGWPYALQIAGWGNEPVWTGSCPCQPFSTAARGRNHRLAAEEHLWPAWCKLIAECRPSTVFGEQVAQAGDWLDEVCDGLEAMGYACGAAILPACGVGHDHARPRIYFVGHTDRNSQPSVSFNAKASGVSRCGGFAGSVGASDGIPSRMVLRGYGNAIVPQVAAEFVGAYLDAR